MKSFSLFTSMLAAVLCTLPAGADVVFMKDGRQIEGQILQAGDQITIDAKIAGIRATLTLHSIEIREIKKQALPNGFFDPPAAETRVSDPTQFTPSDSVYLEIPVKGGFGKEIATEGLRRALSYARQHNVKHLVLNIDSDGGDLDQAGEMSKLLDAHDDYFTYHAVVSRCLDDALVFVIRSDTLHIRSDVQIGSTGRKLSELSDKISADQEDILRAQIARRVVERLQKKGRSGRVIQAMIDPAVSLAAWQNSEGWVDMGDLPPADLAPDKLIFKVGAGELLKLDYRQLHAAKAPEFNGDISELGKVLKLDNWKAESDYAVKTMAAAAASEKAKADSVARVFEARVHKNVSRRTETNDYLSHNMGEAAKWDPNKGNYQSYSQRWNWGYWGGGDSTDYLTKEARKNWRERTDASVGYLQRAVKGILTAQKLDKEAMDLGLQPTFKPGELDTMLDDIKVKLRLLASNRNNRETPGN